MTPCPMLKKMKQVFWNPVFFCWNSKLVDPNILREGFSDDVDGEDIKKMKKGWARILLLEIRRYLCYFLGVVGCHGEPVVFTGFLDLQTW